jgi:ABC-type multidrug transport system ATPase subunit
VLKHLWGIVTSVEYPVSKTFSVVGWLVLVSVFCMIERTVNCRIHVLTYSSMDDEIKLILCTMQGGQRRRVTVGEMMQGQNAVACADEISTGLDAAVTYDICNSIVTFTKATRTTRIVSLLQPGPETFSLFDEVVLLSEGLCVYAGPIDEVVDYFESLGYIQPATMDVADFLQSIPTTDGMMLFDKDSSPYEDHLSAPEFAEAFKKSPQYARIVQELDSPYPVSWKSSVPEEYKKPFQNSFCTALNLNLQRHLVLWKRDYGFIIGKTFENIGMAAATGRSNYVVMKTCCLLIFCFGRS